MVRQLVASEDDWFPPSITGSYRSMLFQAIRLLGADLLIDCGTQYVSNSKAKYLDQTRSQIVDLDRVLSQGLFGAIVDNFQCYLSDLLLEILNKRPEILSGGSTRNSIVFEHSDISELKRVIIERHVVDLGYKRVDELNEYFREKIKFPLVSSRLQSLRLQRIVQIRNVIAHNRGVVSSIFLSRTGAKSDKLGEPVRLPNIHATQSFLFRVAKAIDGGAMSKFGLEGFTNAKL